MCSTDLARGTGSDTLLYSFPWHQWSSAVVQPSRVTLSAVVQPSRVTLSAVVQPSRVTLSAVVQPSRVTLSAVVQPSRVTLSAVVQPFSVTQCFDSMSLKLKCHGMIHLQHLCSQIALVSNSTVVDDLLPASLFCQSHTQDI